MNAINREFGCLGWIYQKNVIQCMRCSVFLEYQEWINGKSLFIEKNKAERQIKLQNQMKNDSLLRT